jgi:hypothetical protein
VFLNNTTSCCASEQTVVGTHRQRCKNVTRENIVRCCVGCNASKGAKALVARLESKYCQDRGITRESVASIINAALPRTVPIHMTDDDSLARDAFKGPYPGNASK